MRKAVRAFGRKVHLAHHVYPNVPLTALVDALLALARPIGKAGKHIAHTSNLETGAAMYGTWHLAVSSATGGDSKLLTRELDRRVFQPGFSRQDDSIYFLLEDSGEQGLL